jgi:hypothetical protein
MAFLMTPPRRQSIKVDINNLTITTEESEYTPFVGLKVDN